MWFFKKTSPRRTQVRKNITAERFSQVSSFITVDRIKSSLLWLLFVALSVPILSFESFNAGQYRAIIAMAVIVITLAVAAGFYIFHYQGRILKNHARALSLVIMFVLL